MGIFLVGYTMRDIRYKWNEGFSSVGVSNEVSLPQFRVLGHRQRAMEISLSTGNLLRRFTKFLSTHNIVHYKLLLVKFSISGYSIDSNWVTVYMLYTLHCLLYAANKSGFEKHSFSPWISPPFFPLPPPTPTFNNAIVITLVVLVWLINRLQDAYLHILFSEIAYRQMW